jgi:hypothetical protein
MRRTLPLLCAAPLAAGLGACGKSVSTSSFQGEQRQVARRIADFQSDATAADEKKVCANDLAAAVVGKLGGRRGCERAITHQLREIDNLEVSIESIRLAPGGTTAQARVKSVREGKRRPSSLSLVKEGGAWKVSGL